LEEGVHVLWLFFKHVNVTCFIDVVGDFAIVMFRGLEMDVVLLSVIITVLVFKDGLNEAISWFMSIMVAMLKLETILSVMGTKGFTVVDSMLRLISVEVKMSVSVLITVFAIDIASFTSVESMSAVFVHWLLDSEVDGFMLINISMMTIFVDMQILSMFRDLISVATIIWVLLNLDPVVNGLFNMEVPFEGSVLDILLVVGVSVGVVERMVDSMLVEVHWRDIVGVVEGVVKLVVSLMISVIFLFVMLRCQVVMMHNRRMVIFVDMDRLLVVDDWFQVMVWGLGVESLMVNWVMLSLFYESKILVMLAMDVSPVVLGLMLALVLDNTVIFLVVVVTERLVSLERSNLSVIEFTDDRVVAELTFTTLVHVKGLFGVLSSSMVI